MTKKSMFNKQLIGFVIIACFLVFPALADSIDSLPDWMGNSQIALMNLFEGRDVTIGEFYGGTPKENTETLIEYEENTLIITNEMFEDDELLIKIETTYVIVQSGDSGLCCPIQLTYETANDETETITCENPTAEPKNYGLIIGFLERALPDFYNQTEE